MTKRNDINPTKLADLLKTSTGKSITDGEGLSLVVSSTGNKAGSWRYEYTSPLTGKTTRITLGRCWVDNDGKTVHGMGVAAARVDHKEARAVVGSGDCPVRKAEREEKLLQAQEIERVATEKENKRLVKDGEAAKHSFKDCAQQLAEENATRHTPSYLKDVELLLTKYAYPFFGNKHIAEVTEEDIYAVDKLLSGAGKKRTLRQVRMHISAVVVWAKHPARKLRTTDNPVYEDKKLWDGMRTVSLAAAVTPEDAREVMLAVHAWKPENDGKRAAGNVTVKKAILFTALTAQRQHVIAAARKEEFNLDAGTWTIPAQSMKGARLLKEAHDAKPHVVYLSAQAVALLKEQFARFEHSPWVFPGQGTASGSHMSLDAINARLRALGLGGKHCAHGFRPMMRTLCEEKLGKSPLVLEQMLAHKQAIVAGEHSDLINKLMTGGMGNTYARAKWSEQQAEAFQAWADYLEDIVRPKLALAA